MNSFALDVLNPLVRGTSLEREEARSALREILEGRVDGVLIASFLTALTAKGETAEEMTGFIDAMIEAATTFSIGPDAIDVVGTGGDQLHSVNVSTMAALAVAGCGVPVAKHGNRAASSSVGSADVLEALGVRLDAP
jgi:anthranilate phosphoribosyltransferase